MKTNRFTQWTALDLLKSACRKKTRFTNEKALASAFTQSCRRYFATNGWMTSGSTTTKNAKSTRMWTSWKRASMYASPTWRTLVGHYGPSTKCSYHFQCVTPNGNASKMSWAVAQCVGQCMNSLYSGYQPCGTVWVNGTMKDWKRGTWQTYVNQLWSNEGIFLNICVGGKTWIHPMKTFKRSMAKAA